MELKNAARKKIIEICEALVKLGYNVSVPELKNYNYEATVSSYSEKAKIQIYFGKKGLKTVIQGNKNSELFAVLGKRLHLSSENLFPKENEINEPEQYIGADESGKGDIFGPLCAAAVFADKQKIALLRDIGVKDSKLLSDSHIVELAVEIKNILKNSFKVACYDPERYNSQYERFNNLNLLLADFHVSLIEEVSRETGCKLAIVDKFADEKVITNMAAKKNLSIDFEQIERGERFAAVAAASILARASFINWFEKKSFQGLKIPKGASAETISYAQKFFNQYGANELAKIAKTHFNPIKKIIVS